MSETTKDNQYRYVIVGGGMVAGYVVKGIRQQDPTGAILVISAEADAPYERPALSKKLWLDDEFTEEDIRIGAEDCANVTFRFKTTVTQIDRQTQTLTLAAGDPVHYDKLLLATGCAPRKLDGPDDSHVLTFRQWSDYRKLRKFSGQNQHVVIVGGGFVGTELAASLAQNQTQVTLVFPEEDLGMGKFPEDLQKEFATTFERNGVELCNQQVVASYQREGDHLVLTTKDGTTLTADTIVMGLGVTPRLDLARDSDLKLTEGGVEVDQYLQTSDPHIWAAGDIAAYPDKLLGRQRFEHVDHARLSGELAGANLAGAHQVYQHTPYFYSMTFDISWQAIGNIDLALDQQAERRGMGTIVYFLDAGKLAGVLVWNVAVDLDDVRKLLANPPKDPQRLLGSLPVKEE